MDTFNYIKRNSGFQFGNNGSRWLGGKGVSAGEQLVVPHGPSYEYEQEAFAPDAKSILHLTYLPGTGALVRPLSPPKAKPRVELTLVGEVEELNVECAASAA